MNVLRLRGACRFIAEPLLFPRENVLLGSLGGCWMLVVIVVLVGLVGGRVGGVGERY